MTNINAPDDIKAAMLDAPDGHLGKAAKAVIERARPAYPAAPGALQILEVIDTCVHGGEASSFLMFAFGAMLEKAVQDEHTTVEHLAKQATWREKYGS